MATDLLTPRDLADAIGVSESSVRRWVDSGEVRMSRTQGGHRRIPLAEAVRFIRSSGATVVRPEILGLAGEMKGASKQPREGDDDELFEALRRGNALLARGIITAWFLSGRPVAAMFDGPVRAAMSKLGELWHHDERGILIEHRATDIIIEAIHQLRAIMPAAGKGVPVAVGGAPSDDHYLVPSLMAATVLRDAGYRDLNYGGNTPLPLLAAAAGEHHARLVWVSVSTHLPARPLRDDLLALAAKLKKTRATLIVGGRFSPGAADLKEAADLRLIGSMTELAGFAAGALAR